MLQRKISIAPMLDCTDRHDRYLLRLLTRRALLYTEMVTTGALLHGDRDRLLGFDPAERPLALQLGGSDPADMAACARIAQDAGYDEVNINVGCPSDRVQSGRFGACLMAEPGIVAACYTAMSDAASIPVTVKTRIGIDERDSYEDLADFVGTVASAGCGTFIIHARKAWLSGLSPKQNREVPPLRYETVYRLKRDFPHLEIVINGGIASQDAAAEHLQRVDGVMIGREAYHNPYHLAGIDRRFFGDDATPPTRHAVLAAYLPYVTRQLALGVPLGRMSRHLVGLFQGVPGARAWRRRLSEDSRRPGAGAEVIEQAAREVMPGGVDGVAGADASAVPRGR